MNTQELGKKLAIEHKMIRAEKYDVVLRDFDNKVEVIGLVPDPTYDIKDFEGREMLFPKRWVTLGVLSQDMEISL